MVRFFIKLFLFIFLFSGRAQEYSSSNYIKELNIKFTGNDLKTFEKGAQMLNSAAAIQKSAEEKYNALSELEKKEAISDEYNDILKELLKASDMYRQGHKLIFDVFKFLCDEFWFKMKRVQHFAEGVEKGKYYEGQARKNLIIAEQRRSVAASANRFDFIKRLLKEANELEETAVRDQGRALQVYKDYPVEYNYGWENDITLEELNELYKNPAIKEPPEDIYATVDTTKKIEPKLKEEVIFKVQIAAHTVPITEEYLRTIYKGSMKIDMIYEDEWYKYSIGRYKTFDEAQSTLQSCKVRKAFIVAYQGGKKVTVNQAVDNIQ